jgi:hypothetical protein
LTRADLEWLDQHRVPRRNPVEDAGSLVSRMRDEEERLASISTPAFWSHSSPRMHSSFAPEPSWPHIFRR